MEATVHLENVDVAQNENVVLHNVSLTIQPGEFLYLIGKTGSGKSSLLKVLYGELPVQGTRAQVCGFDLLKLKRKQIPFLRRKLGIVFQDFELLTDRSVNDNPKFVLKATGWKDKKAMEERMESVLAMVGLDTKGYKMPFELSGGEQQRVAIARALLNDPELILADEPTGNLDPTTTAGILSLLIEIARSGTAVLMATHDYTSMKKFEARTIICADDRLKEAGEINHFSDFTHS